MGPSGPSGPHVTFQGCAPRRGSRRQGPWLQKQGCGLLACLPAWQRLAVSAPRGAESLSSPTNCSGSPGGSGACAALREGRGPGGCPPGIAQPTAVPAAGAGAWPRAWKPGSHDECLGGRVCEVTGIIHGHKLLQAAAVSTGGLECAEGVGGGFGHGRALPFPGSQSALESCWQTQSPLPRDSPHSPEEPPVILKHKSDYVLWLPCLSEPKPSLSWVPAHHAHQTSSPIQPVWPAEHL